MILQTPSKQGEKRKSLRRSVGRFNLDAAAAGLDPEQESPLSRTPSRKRHQPLNESMIRHWRSNVANEMELVEEEDSLNPRASTATLTSSQVTAPPLPSHGSETRGEPRGDPNDSRTYEATKPLQTAFNSSGLVSKQAKASEIRQIPPETPCKRRPESLIHDFEDQRLGDDSRLLWQQSPFSEMTRRVQQFSLGALDDALQSPTRPLSEFAQLTSTPHASGRAISAAGAPGRVAQRFVSDASTITPGHLTDQTNTQKRGLRQPSLIFQTPRSSPSTFLSASASLRSPANSTFMSWDASRDFSHGTADTSVDSIKPSISDSSLQQRFAGVVPVGMGEFSCVWSVLKGNKRYAVKRTKKVLSGTRERLRRYEEVNILKALRPSPEDSIVGLAEAWEEHGYLYIMTEFCENGNLDAFLDGLGARLDEWRVWKIMADIAHGLRYIHERGYCHLDLKPANVFITFEGSLKIGDFGMATKLPAPPHIEREGDREYIAPEVLSHNHYDTPADVFSFGIMMVETAANIVLPDNGEHWHKLRSGDLSEAGKLSSSDLTSIGESGPPPWAPAFMVDEESQALDSLVKAMISPKPSLRPSAAAIIERPEMMEVEARRQSSAIVYEGDFGPAPDPI